MAPRCAPLRLAVALLLAASVVFASNEGAETEQMRKLAAAGDTAQKEVTPAELAKLQAEYAAKLKADFTAGVQAKNKTREANVTAVKAKSPPPKKRKTPVKVLPGGNPNQKEGVRKLRAKIAALLKKWGKNKKSLVGAGWWTVFACLFVCGPVRAHSDRRARR